LCIENCKQLGVRVRSAAALQTLSADRLIETVCKLLRQRLKPLKFCGDAARLMACPDTNQEFFNDGQAVIFLMQLRLG
jgi:hypothetical protein